MDITGACILTAATVIAVYTLCDCWGYALAKKAMALQPVSERPSSIPAVRR